MTTGNSTILANITHQARQNPRRPPLSNRTSTVQAASDPKKSPAAQQNPYSEGAAIQTVTAAFRFDHRNAVPQGLRPFARTLDERKKLPVRPSSVAMDQRPQRRRMLREDDYGQQRAGRT